MKDINIPFHKTHLSDEMIDGVVEAMKSGWLTMGPKTIEFEREFKRYIGADFTVSMNSATAALHLALKAVGLKQEDEVIIPTTTFVATAEVVTYFNAIPVLCDIEKRTHNIDVSKIEALITKKTKAIIVVHFAGQPCDMDEIYKISQKYGLSVIEDAAHALPSKYKGVMIGSLKGTDITCFSFYATKTLSTGEGGMSVTDNKEYAESMSINRLHGLSRNAWNRYDSKGSWYYDVLDNGNKYNTTDICSAIGLVQLKKQNELQSKRVNIATKYSDAFSANVNITVPYIKSDRETSWHLYVIKVKNRDGIFDDLKRAGVNCSVHFIPVHKHTYYKNKYDYKNDDYANANEVFETSLSLPIYPDMTEEDIEYVINKVIKVVDSYNTLV